MDQHGKTRIILAKPSGERAERRPALDINKASESRSSDATTPTRILKSKDGGRRTASPAPQTAPSSLSFALSSASGCISPSISSRDLLTNEDTSRSLGPAKIQIQQKSLSTTGNSGSQHDKLQTEGNTLEARLSAFPEMRGCVKLVDEYLQWCDQISEFLQDQSDFLVVGVLGLQGTGKSTIMSQLNVARLSRSSYHGVFKSQNKDQVEKCMHCTKGIDIIITDQRMILLDVQPILSPSIMDYVIKNEKKFPVEFNSTENALEIQSLQMAAFLFTVCHTIIIVQDWFTDPNMLRFVQSAEMLRPSALLPKQDGGLDDTSEYCPHIVFVHNKCTLTDFEPAKVKLMQELYNDIFQRSKLKYKGDIGVTSGNVIPSLCPKTCGESVNLFLLPRKDFDSNKSIEEFPEYRGHQGFQQLMENLREQITSMPRSPMLPTTLTEKNWFHYAAKTWETVNKSGLFMEYCRLLA